MQPLVLFFFIICPLQLVSLSSLSLTHTLAPSLLTLRTRPLWTLKPLKAIVLASFALQANLDFYELIEVTDLFELIELIELIDILKLIEFTELIAFI